MRKVGSRELEVTFHSGSDLLPGEGEITSCANPQFSPVMWPPGMGSVLQEAPLVSGTQRISR